jgi:hypothetical protein
MVGWLGNQLYYASVYLTLFYTRRLGIAVLHVMVPQPFGFQVSPFFGILIEGYAAIQGEGAACCGGVGSLMTQDDGSVTTQSIAFKYVMASEPYRYT